MRLELADRAEIPGGAAWILANSDRCIADERVRRHRQIIGRRHAAIDPPGRIVFGAVTGTEITAQPAGDRRGGARLRIEHRDAAEMGTYTNQDPVFRLDRAMPI